MKPLPLVLLVLAILLVAASPALADGGFSGPAVGAGIGVALTLVGAGYGFGKIGATALESIARQPEVRADIRTTMIVIAALLEGATFFALIVCILIALAAKS
jgi:F-type H+-transporting ATPase subunit c